MKWEDDYELRIGRDFVGSRSGRFQDNFLERHGISVMTAGEIKIEYDTF
jgi:hypothetical protein